MAGVDGFGSRTVWAFAAKATAEIAAQLQTTTKFKGQRIWVTTPRTHPKPLSFEILNKDDPPLVGVGKCKYRRKA